MDVREKTTNEMRLIDANAFLKDILTAGIGKTIIEYSESDIGYMIRKRPTVDAVPVVHGRWIEKSDLARKIYFECSHCGAHENKHTAIKGYYCWRCGAKMDGGED